MKYVQYCIDELSFRTFVPAMKFPSSNTTASRYSPSSSLGVRCSRMLTIYSFAANVNWGTSLPATICSL